MGTFGLATGFGDVLGLGDIEAATGVGGLALRPGICGPFCIYFVLTRKWVIVKHGSWDILLLDIIFAFLSK